MRNALVLSGGGLFGAYQAGVWAALSEFFEPDGVVGASVGALNGWAIAGGASGEEIVQSWLDGSAASIQRWRPRLWPAPSLFAPDGVQELTQDLLERYQPRMEVAVVALDWPLLRPRIYQNGSITATHLMASSALPGMFPPVRLEGRYHCDGGVTGSLPLWAAWQLGATRAVGVNVMHHYPSRLGCWALGIVRGTRGPKEQRPPEARAAVIHHSCPLGRLRDLALWNPGLAERWVDWGYRDTRSRKQEILDMLE